VLTNQFVSAAFEVFRTSAADYTYVSGLTGTAANDLMVGTAAADVINGAGGMNLIYAGAGNDTVHGGAAADILVGGTGNDTLHGNAGNDTLVGYEGFNTLYGGDGNDVYVLGLGHEEISDTGGVDTIDVGVLPEGNDVFLRRVDDNLVIMADGTARATILGQFAGTAQTIEHIWSPDEELLENLLGGLNTTSGNDVVTVWAAGTFGLDYGSTINGGAGNDIFFLEDNGNGLAVLGGDGDDEFVMDTMTGWNYWYGLDGGAGWDRIVIGADQVFASSPTPLSIEEVSLRGDGTFSIMSSWGSSLTIEFEDESQSLVIDAYDGANLDLSAWTFENRGAAEVKINGAWSDSLAQTIVGSSGNDYIAVHSGGTREVHAGAGDDTVAVVETWSTYDAVLDVYLDPSQKAGINLNTNLTQKAQI
jgi:hypothetical protein